MSLTFINPNEVSRPNRDYDAFYNGDYYWFKEMVMGRIKSNLSYEYSYLAECPMTRLLMYSHGYHPLGWYIVEVSAVQQSYVQYKNEVAEQILLV